LDGDPEANLLHIAIEKWHWSPSQIDEWFNAEQSVKAFYYASVDIKAKRDKEEADKIKTKSKSGRWKR
jgi:regulator of sigma D